MPGYDWEILVPPTNEELAPLGSISPIIASILWHRNLRSPDDLKAFINSDYDRHLADPFLFSQMENAVNLIERAILQDEFIMVHGDYDADGVTSTVILVEALKTLGARIDWYVPDRYTEGYGLRKETINKYIADGVRLLIAVDCGTSNIAEVAQARQSGMDVLIIDHHQSALKRPPGIILNPVLAEETYPFRGLSSAGVAYTLIRALSQFTNNGQKLNHPQVSGWEKWLLDLVAISTVADLMPLRGENRVLVKYGLKVLAKTKRPGLKTLLNRIGANRHSIDEQTIGYHIAPRLNAAGRLRHASTAVKLLLTNNYSEANRLADELEQINGDRQRLTATATDEAWEQIEKDQNNNSAHVVYAPHWSPGILGLVAGRLTERLWKPVAVMTDHDEQIVGSIRSISGIDLMEIMPQGAHLFERYGGHPGASGFTIDPSRRQEFIKWFVNILKHRNQDAHKRPLKIDAILDVANLDGELLNQIDNLAPFGIDHSRPLFLIERLICQQKYLAGISRQHLKISATQKGQSASLIGFKLAQFENLITPGQPFDAVVEPTWNTWNGLTSIQLRLIDFRSSI